jgi:hypothetical protein
MPMANNHKLHIADFDTLSDARTLEILNNRAITTSDFKIFKVGNAEIELVGFPTIVAADLPNVQKQQFETKCATELFGALEPVQNSNPNLLFDPKFWAWVSLVPMRDYILARWCGGAGLFGKVLPADISTGYFFTKRGDLKGHTRSGARRLYIAAKACQLADGNLGNLSKFFADTDLYTGIFERRMSLDSEIAVELAIALVDKDRATRRYVLRSVQLMLGTIALEYLQRNQKKELIRTALSDYSVSKTS